ncbi:MAG: response regulator, partial [bacterium]
NVVTASDGLEALEAVQKQIPDLISLDLVMPKHSGAKLVHELRKQKEWARIPILIVTGHAHDDMGKADFEQLTMSGPGVYLEKPVKPKEYVKAVRNILQIEDAGEALSESDGAQLREELKALVDTADEEKMKKALRILREESQ